MRTGKLGLWLMILCATTGGTFLPRAHAIDKAAQKKILRQARQGYYNLREHGFAGAQADIRPQWQFMFKALIQSDPSRAQVFLERMNRLHFRVSLDPAGDTTVTHQWAPPAPADAESADAYRQLYAGMDGTVSGFFAALSLFMLGSPFPEVEDAYELEEADGQYRLSYRDGPATVAILMTKDFAITELKTSTPDVVSTMRPQLMKTPQGFVLTGLVSDYTPTVGHGVVHSEWQIDYQDEEGLQLPYHLHANSTVDGKPNEVVLVFADYRLTPH